MFVSCDHCFAEYELDDAKIPAGGARLRCKSCDHFFVIVPSETTDLSEQRPEILELMLDLARGIRTPSEPFPEERLDLGE